MKGLTEAQISAKIARRLGALPNLLLMRNNNGVLEDKTGRPVKYGLGVGTPDFVGILKVTLGGIQVGVWVGFEVKRPDTKLREEQRKSHELWEKFGAQVFTVRSEDEAEEAYLSLARKFGGFNVC